MFNEYPYTDLHNLNLDWFLDQFKKMEKHLADLKKMVLSAPDATNANPGQAPIADGAGGWAWGNVQGGGSGLTDEVKNALLACFRGVAWRGDADPETLYGALDNALNPPADLASISVVYSGGTVDAGASLESLKTDLTVTAHYTDSTSETVTAYTLSGNLAEIGEQTITVTYGGKTATFTVTITSDWEYVWDLTESLTDKINGRVAVASAGTGVDAPAITSGGLAFTAATQRLSLGDIDLTGKIMEIDVASMNFIGNTANHIRFLTSGMATINNGAGPIIYRSGEGWQGYGMSGRSGTWSTSSWMSGRDRLDRNYFSGKKLRLVNNLDDSRELYVDDTLVGTITNLTYANQYSTDVAIGGCTTYNQSQGDQCYNMVISGVRIKDIEEA